MVVWLNLGALSELTEQPNVMYNKDSNKDWVSTVATAVIGASLAATFSVNQGRDPIVALFILIFAVASTLIIDRYL